MRAVPLRFRGNFLLEDLFVLVPSCDTEVFGGTTTSVEPREATVARDRAPGDDRVLHSPFAEADVGLLVDVGLVVSKRLVAGAATGFDRSVAGVGGMADIVLPAHGFDGGAGVDTTRRRRRPSREDAAVAEEDSICMITGRSPDGRRNTGEAGCKKYTERERDERVR